ncbi:hypothetical protein ACFRAQ_22005 [Nocardia sp. NPDC056611]|uniref:hypothetical protein n=1 Tax=Nocardia sp. NPDC056611 TaxID=3345877 RepID=UPI00366E38A8
MANAAALGFVIGAATGAVICGVTIIGIPLIPLCAVGPGLQLALVGLLVGAIAPNSVPQILPWSLGHRRHEEPHPEISGWGSFVSNSG